MKNLTTDLGIFSMAVNGSVDRDWMLNVRLVQASCYIPLIMFGTIGNVYVMHILFRVLSHGLTSRPPIYQYILSLSVVDMAFLQLSWLMIYYIYAGDWTIGLVPCKLLWIGESLNKTFSVYLLVWLSFDRYRTVTKHEVSAKRSNVLIRVVLPQGVVITVFCLPLYIFSTVQSIGNTTVCMPTFPVLSNMSVPTGFPIDTQYYYYMLLCVCFFVVPASLITTFYCLLIRTLRAPTLFKGRKRRHTTVTRSVALVVIFYFVCWTPYWIFQCFASYILPLLPQSRTVVKVTTSIQTIIYSLPYINSGLNPILYGVLNRKLRQEFRECMTRRARLLRTARSMSLPAADMRERLAKRHQKLIRRNERALAQAEEEAARRNCYKTRLSLDVQSSRSAPMKTRSANPSITFCDDNHMNMTVSNATADNYENDSTEKALAEPEMESFL